MNKKFKAVFCAALLLSLMTALALPAFASEPQISIETPADLLEFADHCVMDSYSRGVTVSLQADVDLSDTDFTGIPYFDGTFLGNGHAIFGLVISQKGSEQGLFRYLGEHALVQDLVVRGTVEPQGSRRSVGGIVGQNLGVLHRCSFDGTVTGTDLIGGIAGSNGVSGVIEDCDVSGSLHGNHMVGGIAGENFGLIRSCRNHAFINTRSSDNDIRVSQIHVDTVLGTEAADTVTDLGGIAGTSTGVIRNCENHGDVGYPHMGYNVGGIVGRQKGLICTCSNFARVSGRKEVGGIVGQMEPVADLEFSEDTLQILQNQLSSTSGLASQASSNLHNSAQELSTQMSRLHRQADTAADAICELLPVGEDPVLPDLDRIRAAHNALSSSISDIQSTMQAINDTSGIGIRTAAGDIRAISDQLSSMASTLNHASEHLGGTVTDLSDLDTEEDLTGKLLECTNYGSVCGDLNIGGITGAVAWENDLDPEDDLNIRGSESLSFESSMRAVLLRCRNDAAISVQKRNAGGICGNLSLGLIRDCTNTGTLDAPKAQYVGGIAGTADGFIRSCNVKCSLHGASFVGGIAGSATEVTDCRSLVRLPEDGERLGTVLGFSDADLTNTDSIRNNVFLSDSRFGAIDGISCEGIAEPRTIEEFLSLENLSPVFRQAEIRFMEEDGTSHTVLVDLGQPLTEIPPVPEQDGMIGTWEQLEDLDLSHIYFDLVVTPHYESSRTVIESDVCRKNGTPVLLAEGEFTELQSFSLTKPEQLPTLSNSDTVLESWVLPDFGAEAPTVLRIALPESLSSEDARVFIRGENTDWHCVPVSISGTHLVFEAEDGVEEICLVRRPAARTAGLLGAGMALAGLLICCFGILHHRKKSRCTSSDA